MEPGFFLDIADNTGDTFSYIVLPVKYWNEILVHRYPTTLVRSMLRSRIIDSPDSPTCVNSPEGFKVYNRHREELFGTEEMETHPQPAIEPVSLTVNDDIIEANLTSPTAPDNNMGVSEHDIEGPMSLYTSLLVEEEIRFRPNP